MLCLSVDPESVIEIRTQLSVSVLNTNNHHRHRRVVRVDRCATP